MENGFYMKRNNNFMGKEAERSRMEKIIKK